MLWRRLSLIAGSVGFSLRWLLLQRSVGSTPRTQESWPRGHVESSQTRAGTQVPCTARWILSYWTTTEAPVMASIYTAPTVGFPGSSVGKESTCDAGDPGLIPGSGRSPGEGIGYPLQYSWASRVAQLVKNPPTMRETWVQSLCWEDPLEKGMATHSGILAWETPWSGLQSMGSQRIGHD